LKNKFSPISLGKYLVSPLSQRQEDGRYRASVSIRSGSGTAVTDRVMRFVGSFDSDRAARRFARAQGLAWVASVLSPVACAAPHELAPAFA